MKESDVPSQPTDRGVISDTPSAIPISEWSDDFLVEFERECVENVKKILRNYNSYKADRYRKAREVYPRLRKRKESAVQSRPTGRGVISDTASAIPISEWNDDFQVEFERECVENVKEILGNYNASKEDQNRKVYPRLPRATESQRIIQSQEMGESSTASQANYVWPETSLAETVPKDQNASDPPIVEENTSLQEQGSQTDEESDASAVSDTEEIPPSQRPEVSLSKTAEEETVPKNPNAPHPPLGEDNMPLQDQGSQILIHANEESDASNTSDIEEISPPQRPEVTIDEQAVAKLCEMIYNDYRNLCTKTTRLYMALIYKHWMN